jgi:hypothetical protein
LSEYITKEGATELEKQDKQFQRVILAHATLLAQKDGLGLIEAVHVKKASKKVTHEPSNAIKWVLAMSSVLLGLAFFQMAIIYASSQLYLWLLPIFSIVWVIAVAYIFRDFL